jgi:hypothetical protein
MIYRRSYVYLSMNIRYECTLHEHAADLGLATDNTVRSGIVGEVTSRLRDGGKVLELNDSGKWDEMLEGKLRTKVEKVGSHT